MVSDQAATSEPAPEWEVLSQRQKDLLAIVVHNYISAAAPVGSATIAETYRLGVSSATIRNELALLEDLGYLTHAHTSAGRMPTEQGYRYFVAKLMQDADLPIAEQRMIRHQFSQVRMNLEQWMRLAAAVLAHTARATSLITAPQAFQTRLKYVKLISVSEMVALVVLVLPGSIIRQEMLFLESPATQEELERVSNQLIEQFQGLTASEITAQIPPLSQIERQAVQQLLDMMWVEDHQRSVQLYRDGLTQMLEQPEFAEPDRVRHLVQVLEAGNLAEPMLLSSEQGTGVQVIIGGEGHWMDMEGYSIVLSQYGNRSRAFGALGVIGPLRMLYPRAVSTVRYVSQLLTELVRDFYSG